MDDHTVKLSLQDAGREMDRRFPGRAWAFFVFPAEPEQRAHYVSNAPRGKVLQAFRDLHARGLPGIPGDVSDS
jgi:hypothetical protein